MTAKHRTPEYQRNAKRIRKRVRAAFRRGEGVTCWRCRRIIMPGEPFDVGHLPGAQASAEHELAPEHRHKTSRCIGNRADGGRIGAAIRNNRARVITPTTQEQSWPI